MNIILEGPDGAGKTTVLDWLWMNLRKPTRIHHGSSKGTPSEQLCWDYHNSLGPADELIRLIDRSWLSEPIYGSVYRPLEPVRVDAAQCRALERQAGHAVVVLCMPSFEVCRENFNKRRETEMLDNELQLLSVYARYGSLEQQTSLPVIRYDYTIEPPSVLLYRLIGLMGRRPKRKVLLVGEQANIRPGEAINHRVPFVAYNKQGCSYWLNNLLDEARIPEHDLAWVNALTEVGHDADPGSILAILPPPKTTIALGQTAADWCRAKGLGPTHVVRHPQHHKRFTNKEPYALIDILKEALR